MLQIASVGPREKRRVRTAALMTMTQLDHNPAEKAEEVRKTWETQDHAHRYWFITPVQTAKQCVNMKGTSKHSTNLKSGEEGSQIAERLQH